VLTTSASSGRARVPGRPNLIPQNLTLAASARMTTSATRYRMGLDGGSALGAVREIGGTVDAGTWLGTGTLP
jgi:hypothetical protein